MTTVFDICIDQMNDFARKDILPRCITFNEEGWMEAKHLHDKNMVMDAPMGRTGTFCGLRYSVLSTQPVKIRVHSETPAPRPGVSLRMEKLDGPLSVEIVGASLSAAQLCDIMRGWLEASDANHWGAFERQLDRIITMHGTFE